MRWVEVEWTEVCEGCVDRGLWRLCGPRFVEAEWTEVCEGCVNRGLWRLCGLRYVEVVWTEEEAPPHKYLPSHTETKAAFDPLSQVTSVGRTCISCDVINAHNPS